MAARKWTEKQRAQQSKKIRQWQPWDKSTGATSTERIQGRCSWFVARYVQAVT